MNFATKKQRTQAERAAKTEQATATRMSFDEWLRDRSDFGDWPTTREHTLERGARG